MFLVLMWQHFTDSSTLGEASSPVHNGQQEVDCVRSNSPISSDYSPGLRNVILEPSSLLGSSHYEIKTLAF